MRQMVSIAGVILVSMILSGCFYPQERKVENQIPYEDQIQSVQTAVNQYQETSGGLLPIKTRDMDTHIYQKYPIDFNVLSPRFISGPPGNAFESGGIFQYILIDVEENPTVKVFDLRIAETIRSLKLRIQSHKYPPYKDKIADNVFTLDYEALGYKSEPYIVSPYTNTNLSMVVDGQGEVYVDYISDLYLTIQESGKTYKPGEDIIGILAENSLIVPAYSLSYTVDENNEPIYMNK